MAKRERVGDQMDAAAPAVNIRPAEFLMQRERAGAAYPNALSFSRSLVRKLLREKWQTEKLHIRLDEEGRGDAVFRITGPDRVFHFMAVSNVFPQNQKVDRSFGVNWDISAAICEGEWTPAREADLRVNIPLQRAGRFDSLTLAFARGNRSERIFDQVVDTLASGQQPDPQELAGVGYVFRTTGFHANGAVGMRSYDGIENGHPLQQSYHVQICLALLMRDFVFDLVDHLAKVRAEARGSASAVPLDRGLKRYLGIGNSAGLGLVPYPSNHARIIHFWTLNNEQALAAARARPLLRDSRELAEFQSLLDKAARYFEQDPRDGNEIFTGCATIAGELRQMRDDLLQRLTADANGGGFWSGFLHRAEAEFSLETQEILYSLLLELHPDIVAAHATRFQAPEAFDLQPAMTLDELQSLLDRRYGWLFASGAKLPEAAAHFWYLPVESSTEPRRGRRGVLPHYEYETRMDAPMRALQLREQLQKEAGESTVADLLLRQPQYRSFIQHLQSIADCDYALLQESTLVENYWPFACMRFVLAFYGMEKLDPRLPRSVKGAFLQGAPLMDEIAAGQDGTWPFPLIPELDQPTASGAVGKTPIRLTETPEAAAKALTRLVAIQESDRTHLPISASEMRRFLSRYLQYEGFSLGEAEQIAMIAILAQALDAEALSALYAEIDAQAKAGRALRHSVSEQRRDGNAIWLDAGQASALNSMLVAMDLAQSLADGNAQGIGLAYVGNCRGHAYLALLAYQGARSGYHTCIEWRDGEDQDWLAIAGPDASGAAWLAFGQPAEQGSLSAQLGLPPFAAAEHEGYRITCHAQSAETASCTAFAAQIGSLAANHAANFLGVRYFPAGEVAAHMQRFNALGADLPVAIAERLLDMGKRFLLTPEIEEQIR